MSRSAVLARLFRAAPLAALATASVDQGQATAEEMVTPLLAGVTIGATTAKAPEAGAYASTIVLYLRGVQVDGSGRRRDLSLRELEVAQSLLVSTDVRILGARYSVLAIQPVKAPDATTSSSRVRQVGDYNTILSPVNLSWDAGEGLCASYGHTYYLPDGTYSASGAKVANGFFTFEQNFGLSLSRSGWDLTANANLDLNALNPTTRYRSGDVIGVDFAATRTFGRVALGAGGYVVDQFGEDRVDGKVAPKSSLHGRENKWREIAFGPYASYDFSTFKVSAWYTQDVYARNTIKAGAGWLRLAFPLNGIRVN